MSRTTITTTTRVLATLPDTVNADMRLLFVGLNPSFHSVRAGYGFASPSNRFWSSVVEAGIITKWRDPEHALKQDRVGMTDLVKRASTRASEITKVEYQEGLARLDRLCRWLSPEIVCVLGITGWRAALEARHLVMGEQPTKLGGRPVHVLPNPSGLNAHTSHADLVKRFRTLLEIVA